MLALVLLAQTILPPEPPPWPPRYTTPQGQATVIQLDASSCANPVRALDVSYQCRPDNTIIVGVPTDAPLGTHEVTDAGCQTVAHIEVVQVQWPSKRLPRGKIRRAPRGRLKADEKAKNSAYQTHENQCLTAYHLQTPLGQPVAEPYRVTTPFGLNRFYGRAKKPDPHIGVDLAGLQEGDWATDPPQAQSIGPGIVVLARGLWREGNTVIVYHGDMVYTAYCHLGTMSVKQGDHVARGAALGTVSNTGASRGTHLHFVMRVGGVPVDGPRSIEKINNTIPPAPQSEP